MSFFDMSGGIRPAAHESHRQPAPPLAKEDDGIDDSQHADVHKHLHNALKAATTADKRGHIFRALSAVNAIHRKQTVAPTDMGVAGETGPNDTDMFAAPPPPPNPRAGLAQALRSSAHRRRAAKVTSP